MRPELKTNPMNQTGLTLVTAADDRGGQGRDECWSIQPAPVRTHFRLPRCRGCGADPIPTAAIYLPLFVSLKEGSMSEDKEQKTNAL